MGFWDITKRILQGKPAFDMPPKTDEWGDPIKPTASVGQTPSVEAAGTPTVHKQLRLREDGTKILPTAEMVSGRTYASGDNIEVWANIQNQSNVNILLDKVYMCGQKEEIDHSLPPGGAREFRVYRGKKLMANSYVYAELYYKDRGNGDYFCAAHMIQYQQQSDNSYQVCAFSLVQPIKDM